MDGVQTGWVKPAEQIGGLDHLGVQAPCIQIYGDQLPGITNVTDRARYYSFYPWLLTEFDRRGWRSRDEVVPRLRQAECLLTLIGHRHAHLHPDSADDHKAATVGSDVISRVLKLLVEGESITLSRYATLEDGDSDRYFKNPYGALGQYYFGALWSLGILQGDSTSEVRVPEETGFSLAASMAKGVPGDQFIQALEDDTVDLATVDALDSFCFCQLQHSENDERENLITFLESGWLSFAEEKSPSVEELAANASRSSTLAYLCQLADTASAAGAEFDVVAFRAMAYTGVSPAGEQIALAESLSAIAGNWQVYQRNELLAIGLQGLFYTALRSIESNELILSTTSGLSRWFWESGTGAALIQSEGKDRALGFFEGLHTELPPFTQWQDPRHEIQAMQRVVQGTHQKGAVLDDILWDSLIILAAIVLRPENAAGYGDYPFPDGYLDYYPANLKSFMLAWQSKIADLGAVEGMAYLTQHFCLDAHLRVAMRKLRQQGKNTFRFEPNEWGIEVKDVPPVTNTTPRFKQAVRILMDLGLLVKDQGLTQVTQRGRKFVEAVI